VGTRGNLKCLRNLDRCLPIFYKVILSYSLQITIVAVGYHYTDKLLETATYAIASVIVFEPSLFHFVVVYLRRPSGKIVSTVVSVPGRIGRACSISSGVELSVVCRFASPDRVGRGGDDSSGSCSLGGSRNVRSPASNATNDAAIANAAPHQKLPLSGSSLTALDAKNTNVSISKKLPTINNQPQLRSKTISK
jgi:hypothetical protein